MKGWAELKEAFWAAVDGGPEERARQRSALAAIDPRLLDELDALLEADARQPFGLERPAATGRSSPPARIGDYEIVAEIGAGGMGEVYRARDTRLQRDVAIKLLRAASGRPDLLARFTREARVLASLTHPHIARVYGLEQVDHTPALVMELIEGPTLARLIASQRPGGLPLRRVLTLAQQIADGLSAAHERHIVHRDLKPGNIALTTSGDVRILDFGIAKSLTAESSPGADETAAGAVIGTPAYMSPEQARGEACDTRTDIWAFGCVLFELLSGRSPFAARTASDSIAAVLERTPDFACLPGDLPGPIRSLIRHCLEKEPARRLRDIADARLLLEDALDAFAAGAAGPAPPRQGVWNARTLWLVAGLAGAVVGLTAATALLNRGAPPSGTGRVVSAIVLPPDLRLSGGTFGTQVESRFALSPDGRRLVLVASDGTGPTRLWIRPLGSPTMQPVAGTDGASFPFWSPDSTALGFVADGRLRTLVLDGEAAVTVSDTAFRSGAWNGDGQILFAPASGSPLYAVPARGGERRQVTTLDSAAGEVQHVDPVFLPDGRRFLYLSFGTVDGGALSPRGLFVASLDRSEPARQLLAGVTQAQYANGRLLFVRNGTLMAQPLDADALTLTGDPVPLVEDVTLTTAGATGATAAYSVSHTGVLAYQAALRILSSPVVLGRDGATTATLAEPADFGDIASSPDGTRIAVSVVDATRSTRDIWVYGSAGGPGRRVTFDAADEFAPVWAPDGTRILYSTARDGQVSLSVVDVGGGDDPRPLQTDQAGLGRFAADWSPDGDAYLYVGGGRAIARSDLWIAPVASPHQARPLLESPFVETHGRIAPDGRWFAYASNETGRLEVYVDRFPARGAKRAVTSTGGGWPRWSRDGRELYYVSAANDLMAARITRTSAELAFDPAQPLFPLLARPPTRLDAYAYDLAAGGRFVVNRLVDDPTSLMIALVINWPQTHSADPR